MIFETSRQVLFMIPIAISLGFGVLFTTLITLVLALSFFLMVEDLHCIRNGAMHESKENVCEISRLT